MVTVETHKWQFKARFRRQAFGWKSQPAITRIKEAVSEIKKVARKDPQLAAEGAVIFLERVSPAIENVDGSSGAIGSAVYRAIEELARIIAEASADDKTRQKWLERLWQAHAEDQIPYIERLADYWGDLCAGKELASAWADDLIDTVKTCWTLDASRHTFFHGTPACLSALYKAERYAELFDLLKLDQSKFWHYQQYAVKALAAMGKKAEALKHAESCRGQWTPGASVASLCEEILLSSGMSDEAYKRYALEANRGTSNLATYRAIARKYPHKQPQEILNDLIDTTPGEEGKWFATAKELGLFELALQLARTSPCDPRTLTRAARDYLEIDAAFAMCAGLSALQWLINGYGYEITGADVWEAYSNTIAAAEKVGEAENVRSVLRDGIRAKSNDNNFIGQILGRELGL
jgi:hypothetical protein